MVECLLDHTATAAEPGTAGAMIRDWEFALIADDTPAGHPLRIRLRERLRSRRCRDAADDLAKQQRAAREKMAARNPEEVAADQERARRIPPRSSLVPHMRRRRAQHDSHYRAS